MSHDFPTTQCTFTSDALIHIYFPVNSIVLTTRHSSIGPPVVYTMVYPSYVSIPPSQMHNPSVNHSFIYPTFLIPSFLHYTFLSSPSFHPWCFISSFSPHLRYPCPHP